MLFKQIIQLHSKPEGNTQFVIPSKEGLSSKAGIQKIQRLLGPRLRGDDIMGLGQDVLNTHGSPPSGFVCNYARQAAVDDWKAWE